MTELRLLLSCFWGCSIRLIDNITRNWSSLTHQSALSDLSLPYRHFLIPLMFVGLQYWFETRHPYRIELLWPMSYSFINIFMDYLRLSFTLLMSHNCTGTIRNLIYTKSVQTVEFAATSHLLRNAQFTNLQVQI